MDYTLEVPAATPAVGAFVAGQDQKLTTGAVVGSAKYTIDAATFVPGAASQTGDCSPPEQQSSELNVLQGQSVAVPTLQFNGCQ
jgi:hypothetical protein